MLRLPERRTPRIHFFGDSVQV